MIASAMMAGNDYGPDTTPPTGPPTSVSIYLYGGYSLVGVQWTNADPLAYTEIGYASDPDGLIEPTAASDMVSPGVTSWESSGTNRCSYWVRHSRGGSYSAWVLAVNVFGCEPDPFEF